MKPIRLSDLIRRASHALTAQYMQQEPGLTLPQAQILRALIEWGPSTQVLLMEATAIDRSTMSQVLAYLCETKLTKRCVDERDKRAKQVTITSAGSTALYAAEDALNIAEDRILKRVPRVARAAFRQALQAIAKSKNG